MVARSWRIERGVDTHNYVSPCMYMPRATGLVVSCGISIREYCGPGVIRSGWSAGLRSRCGLLAPVRATFIPIDRVAADRLFRSEGQRAVGEIAGDRACGGGAGGRVECQGTGGAQQVGDLG